MDEKRPDIRKAGEKMIYHEYAPGTISIGDRVKVHTNDDTGPVYGEVTAIYEGGATVRCQHYTSSVNFKATNVPEWCQGRGGYK